ncbi:MAG: class I SAM-dependent methyltransferase [Chloroflexi bacterium AL-W]|nr:class I SAM-dependent methyltransferase [Chloroflexi bacterium AL-N1]NOK67652.1 class I SAM-dependent methyltransferase [Chloroflexi bacterium AL-N10]NOK75578.1 class I SAM-dependent methyltransferase [Chloroflexi bacterium AL-N5]NOK82366.1 class I SAM-dependent methyltransferase [Chloroflexi bacterium AL-W]NOK90211.1 class I SAM-dependent methyltransferase [Chloroflexi bacterium AL-N15]
MSNWMKRINAALIDQNSRVYEPLVVDHKRKLFTHFAGDVLEIGPGTGANLSWYPPGIHWIGVEPNSYMHPYLHRTATRLNMSIHILNTTAEQLDIQDSTIDVAVATLVLCSVQDPMCTLHEIRRVLKPGGRFVFIEHVAAPQGTLMRRFQHTIQPMWGICADGCHVTRETWRLVEQVGFKSVKIEHFCLPLSIVGPHIAGTAIK